MECRPLSIMMLVVLIHLCNVRGVSQIHASQACCLQAVILEAAAEVVLRTGAHAVACGLLHLAAQLTALLVVGIDKVAWAMVLQNAFGLLLVGGHLAAFLFLRINAIAWPCIASPHVAGCMMCIAGDVSAELLTCTPHLAVLYTLGIAEACTLRCGAWPIGAVAASLAIFFGCVSFAGG